MLAGDYKGVTIDDSAQSQKIKQVNDIFYNNIQKLSNMKINIGVSAKHNNETTDNAKLKDKAKSFFESISDSLSKTINELSESFKPYSKAIIQNTKKSLDMQLSQLNNSKELFSDKEYNSQLKTIYENALKPLFELAKRGDKNAQEEIVAIQDKLKSINLNERYYNLLSNLELEIEKSTSKFNGQEMAKLSEKIKEIESKTLNNINSNALLNSSDKLTETIKLHEETYKRYVEIGNIEAATQEQHTLNLLKYEQIKNNSVKELSNNLETLFNNLQGIDNETQQIAQAKKEFEIKMKLFKETLLLLPEEIRESLLQATNIKDFRNKLSSIDIKKYSDQTQKLIQETSNSFEEMVESSKKIKDKAKEMQDTFQTVNKSITFAKKEIDSIIDVIPDGDLKDTIQSAWDSLYSLVDTAMNIAEAVLAPNPENIMKAIGSVMQIFTKLVKNIISYYSDEEEKLAIKKFGEKKKDVLNNITALQELTTTIKDLNNTLIKNAAQNTSNSILTRNKELNKELIKAFASNFNAKVIANGVKEQDLTLGQGAKVSTALNFWNPVSWIIGLTKAGMHKKEQISLDKTFNELFDANVSTSKEMQEFYNKTLKNMTQQDLARFYEGYDASKTSDKVTGNQIAVTHDFKTQASNLEDIKKQYLERIEKVKKLEIENDKFISNAIMESFSGVSVTSAIEEKKQILNYYKKIYAGVDDYEHIIEDISKKLDQQIQDDKVLITAFDEVRQQTTERLSQGNDMLGSLASGMQSYFKQLQTNLAKVKYDNTFRDIEGKFNEKFLEISKKLKDYRLSGNNDLKAFAKELNFNDLFGQLKLVERVNNDIKDVVQELRTQAKAQGLSEEYVNMMFPVEDIQKEISKVQDMLQTAMRVALDTSSFNQF